jgi:hypothetical protein
MSDTGIAVFGHDPQFAANSLVIMGASYFVELSNDEISIKILPLTALLH